MEYLGPGIWYTIHQQALLTKWDDRDSYFRLVVEIVDTLPCEKCRLDSVEYVEWRLIDDSYQNRYQNMFDSEGRYIGIFVWSYQFHNYVNRKLHKSVLSLESALEKYIMPDNCQSCKVSI